MTFKASESYDTVVLGGGLAGLSAGYLLTKGGQRVAVLEKEPAVGGLSRTIRRGRFRFDLGGHRFFTQDPEIELFIRGLLKDEMISVKRRSKILLQDRLIDYPLRPVSALKGVGWANTIKILYDYGAGMLTKPSRGDGLVSLEDWVIRHFGRTLYSIYFKGYSEKLWGMDCGDISAEWVAQRIKGLSLGRALRKAFMAGRGQGQIPTLAEEFLYPMGGIGMIPERLRSHIDQVNRVFLEAQVLSIRHNGSRIREIIARHKGKELHLEADSFISSIPLDLLVNILEPPAPKEIREAAGRLRYRDMVVIAVMLAQERATGLNWIYIPQKEIPFNRIHEPKNWSERMAPPGKTALVLEFCCFLNDQTWNAADDGLASRAVEYLKRLGFIRACDVLDTVVLKVPKAYPILEVGYDRFLKRITDYLARFRNLRIAGRAGMFRYYNIDHAIKSGFDAALELLEQ